MRKTSKPASVHGRWLILDQASPNSTAILELVKSINGAEVMEIKNKTYVRFPIYQRKKQRNLSHMLKSQMHKHVQLGNDENAIDKPSQYCAVMVKE